MGAKDISNLDTANTVARVAFEEVMETGAPAQYQAFTHTYSTGVENDDLVMMVHDSTAREWLGSKEYTGFEVHKQDVDLKTYELSFTLPRKKVDYDSSGAVASGLSTAVRDAIGQGTDKIVTDSLVSSSGAGPTGFDGVSLINTSHTWGGSSYSNKSTSALSMSTFNTALIAMQGYKKANGEPLSIFPTHMMVGPKLRQTAKEITGAMDRLAYVSATGVPGLPGSGLSAAAAAQIPNIFASDGIQLIVNPRLTGDQDDYWYLMDLSKSEKPMQLKDEKAWTLYDCTDPKDDRRFHEDLYVWSIEADLRAAAGVWACIYGGIL